MWAKACFVLCIALLSTTPVHGALVLTLDQPVQTALPGDFVAFTGNILNTGPEAAPFGIDERFLPVPGPPFSAALPLALAGFMPGPGDSYTGVIFGIRIDTSAVLGDSLTTVVQITALLPTGGTLTSNGVPIQLTVGVPEPGSALLLAVPVLALVLLRFRYARFLPTSR